MSKVEEVKRQAVCLMAEKGFEAMSLRRLAAASGMRSGSVYAHYSTKAQLLLDVYCDYLDDLLSVWMERRHQPIGSPQALQGFVSVYVGFHYARAQESRIVRLDFRSLDEVGQLQVNELKAQYQAELGSILRQGELRGVFRFADLQATQLAILAVMQGLCAEPSLSEPEALEACINAVCSLVGMPAASCARSHGELRVSGKVAAALMASRP